MVQQRSEARIRVPEHIAIIMDGNGRWARQRNLPRMDGHRAGVENIRCILREAARLGVRCMTLYAFSTENWSRPADEVVGLMDLLTEFIDREAMALHQEGVRIRHLGSTDQLPPVLVRRIREAVDLTRGNRGLTVAVALNYGGRREIVHAVRSIVARGVTPEGVDERCISEHLTTSGMPDPDLIIRTSGENRLSNFLIWQAAYAEYWSTPTLWPDFGAEHLRQAIFDYESRDRRFGNVGGQAHTGADGVPESAHRVDVSPFATVQQAIADFQEAKFVLILDDEDRENEGDLAIAAEYATADAINFLAVHARGLICMPIVGSRLDEMGVPMMVPGRHGDEAAFTVSVDARAGVSSGISAHDRAQTVKVMIHPLAKPTDIVMPGHLFPLRYAEGGVLRRPGHTEAAVDLAKLAGLYPAAVICEVMSADGTMARPPQLRDFARKHRIHTITVQQLRGAVNWPPKAMFMTTSGR
jgi:undecaprenyl diphosphate synthase